MTAEVYIGGDTVACRQVRALCEGLEWVHLVQLQPNQRRPEWLRGVPSMVQEGRLLEGSAVIEYLRRAKGKVVDAFRSIDDDEEATGATPQPSSTVSSKLGNFKSKQTNQAMYSDDKAVTLEEYMRLRGT